MATPQYKGAGQPQADNGSWSGLGSWFGGATPAYKPAPVKTESTSTSANAVAQAIDASSLPGLPPGSFVVLVPRGVVAPSEVTDPQCDEQQQ